MPFVANDGRYDGRVAYYVPGAGAAFFVTHQGELVYALRERPADRTRAKTDGTRTRRTKARASARGWALTEELVGGQTRPAGQDRGATTVSDIRGNDPARWRTGQPTFGAVDLGEVWPGVTVALRASGGRIEKIFTVAPGASADRIHVRVKGARALTRGADGALVIGTGVGDVAFTAPVAYQDRGGVREPVSVSYRLKGRSYGFAVGAYDPTRPLVIDPLLQSTFLGGDDDDFAYAIAIHPENGDVYVTGETISLDFPGTTGGAYPDLSRDSDFQFFLTVDGFVARLDSTLTVLRQATYFGGGGTDVPFAIAIEPASGDVYVAGRTDSEDLPQTGLGAQPFLAGFTDAFIARFPNSLTSVTAATYFGGAGDDESNTLVIHSTDDEVQIFIAGTTDSGDLSGTGGAAQPFLDPGFGVDAFVALLTADLGTVIRATYLGGTDEDTGFALALAPGGASIYVAGETFSTDFPAAASGAQSSLNGGAKDVYVSQLTTDLTTIVRSTYLGGTGTDEVNAIAVHPDGDVYVAGRTDSGDFPGTAQGAQPLPGGLDDAYVARLPGTLQAPIVSTYLGGGDDDVAWGLAIHHATSEVYVAGGTVSLDFPFTPGGVQESFGGCDSDVFVARLTSDLASVPQATYLGDVGYDEALALAISPLTGDVYVAGQTEGPFPGTADGAQSIFGGGFADGVVARLTRSLAAADPDLTITKTHAGNFFRNQVGATYTITVTNVGTAPTDGTEVTVEDTLPGDFTLTAIAGPGWTCELATRHCKRSDVLNPSQSYPAITLTVSVAADAASLVTNTATVSGGGDLSVGNNTASNPTTIVSAPDLTIAKTHAGNFSQGQVGATYTITVSNAGSLVTDGSTVTVTDAVPAGLTPTALDGPSWSCTLSTCTRSDTLDPGASYPPITLTVTVAANATGPLTNTVTVSGGGDADPGNNSASDPTTIVIRPDLSLLKSHVGGFVAGQVGATYTLTVVSVGSAPTDGTTVTVTDTLPAGLTATALAGTGWTCVVGTLTCTRADVLAGGASYPAITLTVNVAVGTASLVTNTATVTGGGDVTPGNNGASDPTTVGSAPDLAIAKTHAGNFTQGQVGATYTITVTNAGSLVTDGSTVTVTDTVPAGLTPTALAGTGWSCTLATRTCTRSDTLNPGASYPVITLTVTVAANATGPLTNTVTVSGGGDANPGNNSASDPTTIVTRPDLSIIKSHVGGFFAGQVGATYTLTVVNVGTAPTDGTTVTVTDTLPAGLTATALTGTGWTCVLATRTCTRADVLAGGASYPAITLTVNVADSATGSVTNTATVSGGGDVTPGNNGASDPASIGPAPDLTIAKSHAGSFVHGQVGATYTITVTNVGTAPTDGTTVTVVDTVPAGLTPTALGGPGWTCTLASRTCTRSTVLSPAASYPAITLTVDVAGNASSPLTNTATVSGGGDLTPGNNSAGDVTTIGVAPDLSIAKTHVGDFTRGQSNAMYTIVVSNAGTAATAGTVTVTDTLPAGLTATALAGPGWSCLVTTLTCTRADALGIGGTYPAITLTASVAANAPGSVTNTATVSGGGDVTPGNDTASDPTTVVFADVPASHPFYPWVEALFAAGLTGGCSTTPPQYCPDADVTRGQIAVLLLRAIHGGAYQPPPATGLFVDVPVDHPLAPWIEQFAREGLTGGCAVSPPAYCPDAGVTRGQIALFLLRARHGAGYQPPAATGLFADVPTSHPFAAFIEQLARDGITTGCGPGLYCPDEVVTREQVAVLLVRTFSLPL